MEAHDDDLKTFEVHGAVPLPAANSQEYLEHDGARIRHADYGSGPPVILLHGGLGHSENWGNQVPALVAAGYRAILIDSRGHGASSRDARPFSYRRMAADVAAVMDARRIAKAPLVGWSDGAVIATILGMQAPERVSAVFFFGGNMDTSGVKAFVPLPIISRIFGRHQRDYARLSPTPDGFNAFAEAVTLMMETQPNYSATQLASICVPMTIAIAEHDEFIRRDHAEYLARTIPGAKVLLLPGVSHFAPLQRPKMFNEAMLDFVAATHGAP